MKAPPYICQVCDDVSKPDIKDPQRWVVHPMEVMGENGSPNVVLQILTCPKCSGLALGEIFEGYKKRIRDGFAVEYH